MNRYEFTYSCHTQFQASVHWHFFHLRCMPVVHACQRLERASLEFVPEAHLLHGTDAWGNSVQYGSILDSHRQFSYCSQGVVQTDDYLIPQAQVAGIYRVPTRLTSTHDAMLQLYSGVPDHGSPMQQAEFLCAQVHAWMAYCPHTTQNTTTAVQAFQQRQGVCQDYAHILLALCRWRGIAARYVNGFLLGEGETHAWVEVWHQGAWYGLDPTHNRIIRTGYIKLAHGRDAADCPVNRGVFRGFTQQDTQIKVIVKEV